MADTIIKQLRVLLGVDNVAGFQGGLNSAEKSVRSLGKTVQTELVDYVSGAIAAFAGWQELNFVASTMKEAAALQETSEAWANLATAGNKTLMQMRQAARGTIDDMTLMSKGSHALIMGIAEKDLPELVKISKSIGRAVGRDTIDVFEQLTSGIGRMADRMLKDLGIAIDSENLYKQASRNLGRELSDAEKKQLFFNEAVRQGKEIMARAGEDAGGYADELDRLAAQWKNIRTQVGMGFLETGVLDAAGKLLEFVDKFPPMVMAAQAFRTAWVSFWTLPENVWAMIQGQLKLTDWWAGNRLTAPKPIPGLMKVHGTGYGTIDPEEEKKTFALIAEIQEAYYKFGQQTTEEMIWFYNEQLEAYKHNAKIKEQIEKRLHELRIGLIEKELESEQAAANKIAEIWKGLGLVGGTRITPAIGVGGQIPFPGRTASETAIAHEITLWDQFWNEIEVRSKAAKDFLQGAFSAILNNIRAFGTDASMIFTDVVSVMVDVISGNWVQAGVDFINSIFDMIGITNNAAKRERQRAEEQKRALEALDREIDANIDSIENMTQAEKQRRRALIEAELTRLEIERHAKSLTGRELEGSLAVSAQWARELAALNESLGDFAELKGIKSLRDLRAFLTGEGTNLGYQRGRSIIDHFVTMLGLSMQDQLALYEQLETMLGENVTMEEKFALDEMIKGLRESIAGGAGIGPSQIMRSITSVTEEQGNQIFGVLNTIRALIQQILDMARGMALPGPALAGVTIGTMNIYANSQAGGQGVAEAFVNELRSRGIKVS